MPTGSGVVASRSLSPPTPQATPFALRGCRPVPVSREAIADYEGPVEYWDADTEIVWELRETSGYHEEPRGRLVELVKAIAMVRGIWLRVYGTTDLQELDAAGNRLRIAQADDLIYLDGSRGPIGRAVVVGKSRLPDVLFEVDLTTDIRDRKLALYAGWGIPELWVEVPDTRLASPRKPPGLTILLLEDDRYRQALESVAFPSWRAEEIHAALNEAPSSPATVGALRRVGHRMGQRTGTGPDDDPFLGVERRLSRLEGHAAGRAEGHAEGRVEGHAEGYATGGVDKQASMLKGMLATRNVAVSAKLDRLADLTRDLPQASLLHAVLDCTDEDDFLARVQALRPQ